MCWYFQGVNGAHLLLSTNDKTIKLWKVYEKKVKCVANYNVEQGCVTAISRSVCV